MSRRKYLAIAYGPAAIWLLVIAPMQWATNGWGAGLSHVFAAAVMWSLTSGQITRYRLGYFRGRESLRQDLERARAGKVFTPSELVARYEPWDWK